MVICLEQGADLHTAQLMPLSLSVSCFSKIQIDVTFLVPAHPGSPGQRAVKCVCVRVCLSVCARALHHVDKTHRLYHKKATKWPYFLKILKRAGLPLDHLLHYYTRVIRPVLEYCSCSTISQIHWHQRSKTYRNLQLK